MEMDDNGPQTSCCDTRWSQQLSGLPHKLLRRLMPFQREGVEFALAKNGRCMIADEMGLGKTVQAIAVACAYRQEWPLLVVVPSSLKYPWIEELERWVPELQPGDINLVENKGDIMGIGGSKVTVLGYGLLTTDARPLLEALSRRPFAVVVVDESHYLKSRNAARTRILVPLIQGAKRAVLLTGTPALGRPEELFMQIEALDPGSFGTWSDYAKKYCNAHYRFFGSRRQWDCRGASNLDELHRRLTRIMIRRLKADVLDQLPPKVRQRIPFDLPREAVKEAAASFAQWERLMKGLGSGDATTTTTTTTPFTEVMGLVTQMYKQTAIAKAGAVKDYIKMMLETERLKFLVFAHHLTMLQACTEAAVEAKARYIRIDGSVPSSERIQLVHKFQSDPDTRVAILSIQAAGQGLTFTAASHVVFAELYWNPGHIKQAEDRAHRIGQTACVNVHYLIAKGTFDGAMWAMLNRKEKVTGSTLNGRQGALRAEEGDKDKWEFLSFASAWTPSEMVLPPQTERRGSVFFTHHDKEKQHDIRSFFSPSAAKEEEKKKKKRKRTEEEDKEEASSSSSRDFSPAVKRPPPPARSDAEAACAWSCATCTYANSGLLPFCEMCEAPHCSVPPRPQTACVTLPSGGPSPGGAGPQEPGDGKQSGEEEEEEEEEGAPRKDKQKLGEDEDKRRLEGKQSAGERGEGVRPPPDHTPDRRNTTTTPTSTSTAARSSSSATDANDDDEGRGEGGEEEEGEEEEEDAHPVHPGLQFCASRHTDRIYLYSKDGSPLNLSFVPLDIKLTHWDDLPEAFARRRQNRIQVLTFSQEWTSLPAMKQKLLRRSGLLHHTPTLGLQQLAAAQRPHGSTNRYLSREEVARASLGTARREGGSVRLVARERRPARSSAESALAPPDKERKATSPQETPPGETAPGYLQALDGHGVPLCLFCQLACPTSGGAWDTRFCSRGCQEEFQLRSSQTYMRSRVLEAERGVCQHCGLRAHDLFLQVRDAPPAHRKELLENTWLAQLSLKELNEMVRAPAEGLFWQVDHIRPVYSGGGQCSLDNLQTLCTVCHKARTAQQAKERGRVKRHAAASKVASDIRKFFGKK